MIHVQDIYLQRIANEFPNGLDERKVWIDADTALDNIRAILKEWKKEQR